MMSPALNLIGASTPAISLPSTHVRIDLRELCAHRATIFVYPATGVPGRDPAVDPAPGWDDIPGAAGCTAQCAGFEHAYGAFSELGVLVAGLSSQPIVEQQGFADRYRLGYPLICDAELQLAAALSLPTFTVAKRAFYRRLVLRFVRNSVVEVVEDFPYPGDSARRVLDQWRREPMVK